MSSSGIARAKLPLGAAAVVFLTGFVGGSLFRLPFGAALLVTSLMAMFIGIIWMAVGAVTASNAERTSASKALVETERQLRLLTDEAPVFLAHCDAQKRFKFVNKAYARRFGLVAEDCIGKDIPDVI